MATKKKMLQAAAGNAGGGAGGAGGAALNVEDVFSTYLYEGNGSTQKITNGISLGDGPTDGVYYLSSPSSVTGNNSALGVSATIDGTVSLNSSETKFATNSYDFNGASNIRLSSALIDNSSSFCFETWVYFDSTGASNDMAMLLAQYKSGENGRLLFGAQGGSLVVRYNGGNVALTASVSASTWLHVAWSYDGTTHRLFINGNLEDSTTLDFPIYTGVTTQLGGTDPTLLSGYDLDGKMEDIRLTTGDARYTSSFSPPTASLPVTTGVTDGEGGLVWFKSRDNSTFANSPHVLTDSVTGFDKYLISNQTVQQQSWSTDGPVPASDGFSLLANASVPYTNYLTGSNYASWTFRKAPKFFDVVTYTGNGSSQNISHNLGSVPGMIIVKATSVAANWAVWHRESDAFPEFKQLQLNTTSAVLTTGTVWNSTNPTDSVFSVGNYYNTNNNGDTYVAYLFAHNDGDGEFGPDGDADIIKCGSYTGNGSDQEIDLGFEPQWILTKPTTFSHDWYIWDTMRGFKTYSGTGTNNLNLKPNETNTDSDFDGIALTSTGFSLHGASNAANNSGQNYIYMAIRRDTKVPESAYEVFEPTAYTGNNTANRTVGSLTVDMNIIIDRTKTAEDNNLLFDRMRGQDIVLKTDQTSSEGNGWGGAYYNLDQQHGFSNGSNTSFLNNSSANYISYIWKRAPKFFDVVAYSGGGGAGRTVSHNLGVAPEMIWVRQRNSAEGWQVYHSALTATDFMELNQTSSASSSTGRWNNTEPTATDFTLGSITHTNASGDNYIAYLFASLDGISKVGSYAGNAGTQTIDCGFTTGARFILIKRTDGNSDWFVWDTERGINVASDPYLELNTTNAENPGQDEIDAHASGFIINNPGGSGDAEINKSGRTYIFYAIA